MPGIDFIQDLAVILVVAGVVGWMCQRIGLSVVVGYLVAGMLVGPYTPPFQLITDLGRIDTAAQIGLVFLMFGIGLRLSVRKLRKLGLSLLLTVFASAGIIYYLTRLLGALLGRGETESIFLAAMLMVSSSAIIGKVLQETGSTHERSGQLAMGVTVLEDVVAVVMLTVLTSLVQIEGAAGQPRLTETIGLFGVFVVTAAIVGLLLIPWLLRRMSIAADEELQTLGLAALLFGLAIVAHRAGYSLALGAFLLGTIVAETPHRHQIERTFEGMRDVFSAVFFVAIGMQIDLRLLGADGLLIVGVGLFTLIARVVSTSVGLVLIGTTPKDAFKSGLTLTPIGEFSFIIAQLGITASAVPPSFYPLAVGISLLTTFAAPFLTRRSDAISGWVFAREPRWARVWTDYYRRWLDHLQARQKRNLLWQLSRKRFVQIGVEVLLVTGLLVFAPQMLAVVEEELGRDWLFPGGPTVLFWSLLAFVVLAPLVAIWRNIGALAILYSEVSTAGHPRQARLRPLVRTGIRTVAGAAMYLWLTAFLPSAGSVRWLLPATAVVVVVALIVLRRRLIYWHSELEVELQDVLGGGGSRQAGTSTPWLQSHAEWNLSVVDCVLPDLADCQGQKLETLSLRARFGCTVVGIERQGYMISLPGPDAVLYPRDKVMLMGTGEQVAAGKAFLTRVTGAFASASDFDEVRMEAVVVPADSRAAGRSLAELALARTHGVQVAGIDRAGLRVLNPGPEERLEAGNELLLLGTPQQIKDFKFWLNEEP